MTTKSAGHSLKLKGLVGRNAAASRSTWYPSACAACTSESECLTPEKFDCAGYAKIRAPAPHVDRRISSVPSSRSSPSSGTYAIGAPKRRAYSRTPFTELWLSVDNTSEDSAVHG